MSNFYEEEPFATAAAMTDPDEALTYLWGKRPRDMCLHGESIEKNLKRRLFKMDPLKEKTLSDPAIQRRVRVIDLGFDDIYQ